MMKTLSLNGTWMLHGWDGHRGDPRFALAEKPQAERFLPATVPGCVHLDLMAAGLIGEPAEGLNALAARWVEESQWFYRREFTAPAAALKGRAWLVFERLDYSADVHLNGEKIASHANFFTPLRVEVTGKLKPGRNLLVVRVDSGLWDAGDKPSTGWAFYRDQALTKRHWLRKPQFQFNWDWATRLINVGVSGDVRLEYTGQAFRLERISPLASLDADLRRGVVRVRAWAEGLGRRDTAAVLEASIPRAGVRARKAVTLKPGTNELELELEVESPALWWPRGQGGQELYRVDVSLRAGGAAQKASRRVGFRHVRVVQDPHPEGGTYFYFEVNGRRVFCKGANLVPNDLLLARHSDARLAELVRLAEELNFNFLRVWGGGVYENGAFFDLCDERGFMVWQEFIYACGRFPTTDQAFFENALDEARHQVRRLAPHASLVAWCGNNENETGSWNWGWDKGVVYPDYGFFHLALPKMLAEEDPLRYYQPSSPLSPGAQQPELHKTGDQHPWTVGFANTDFRDYRTMECRFPNEGGFLGPTALPTILKCLPEGHRRIGSFAWQQHDNSVNSWNPSATDRMLRQWLGLDIFGMSLERYCHMAGLLQGEALREYCDNFRRRMPSSGAAVFWMFNDSWAAVRSWTPVDYYMRRTPCFHPVRRALAPVSVVLAEAGDSVEVWGVNDTLEALEGRLRYGLFNLAGGFALDRAEAVRLEPNASTLLARFSRSAWKRPKAQAAFAQLEDSRGGLLARNRLILPVFKDLAFKPAKLHVRLEKGQAVFTSPVFVWGVCLDLDGEAPLADNFFDVWPGVPYRMPWKGGRPPRVLATGNLKGR